jgi:hypothetical protein
LKLRSKLFYGYIIFLVLYSVFILLPAPLPAIMAQYHVSALGLRLIDLTIIIILAGIWFAGFYGYAKLRAYTGLIRDGKDGKQVAKLTKGIFLLVIWLPVSSTISAILNYLAVKRPGLLPAVKIINIYVNLLLPLLGFFMISKGAHGLSSLVKQRPTFFATNVLVASVTYIGLVYYRLVATTPHRTDIYHMPIWIILITVVAPYIYMWSIGLLSVHEMYLYRQKVAGIVYKKSLNLLTLGLCWLVVVSIIFQYLTSLSARLAHLSIYWILAIVYSLLLILSIGFVLVALGARNLQKIEEV